MTCSVEELTPERVVVRVDAPQDGLIVLCDSFAPGWRATVGGEPSPILRANGLFRAVALPAGSHEVVFEYWPVSFFVGWAIALIALSLTAVAGMARLFRS